MSESYLKRVTNKCRLPFGHSRILRFDQNRYCILQPYRCCPSCLVLLQTPTGELHGRLLVHGLHLSASKPYKAFITKTYSGFNHRKKLEKAWRHPLPSAAALYGSTLSSPANSSRSCRCLCVIFDGMVTTISTNWSP